MNANNNISINLNIRGIAQSPTLAINELSKQLQSKGKTIYSMGLGQSPFPVPVPVVDALKLYASEKDYLNVKGLQALRQAVAQFHRQKDQVEIKAKNVMIGPGSKELMFILLLVYYGDIILPTPCWVSYVPQAKIIGRNIRLIHTSFSSNWRLTADSLKKFLDNENDHYKPRLLILNYPSNPDGGSYQENELKKIARIARKHHIIILSDEIYGQLHFHGQHVSIARFYPEGTIISSGLSKWCGAGGWRLGTFAFPNDFDWLINAMAAVASETYTSVSAPIQYAAVKAFKGGIGIERYLQHTRRILLNLSKEITAMLREAKIKVHDPEGAFYLFIDFEFYAEKLKKVGIHSSEALCKKLLEDTGVALLPGQAFQRNPSELSARVAFVNFDGARALSMSETISLDKPLPENFNLSYCEPTIKAISSLAEWTYNIAVH